MARLTSALPVTGREPWTARLGLKLGHDALTSTRPVRGSIANDGAGLAGRGQVAHGLALRRRDQRELHVVAGHGAARQRVQLALERAAEIGVRAHEVVVGRALHAGAAVGRRRVADDVGEHLLRRIAALEDLAAVGRRRAAVDASFVPSAARISPRRIESCCTIWCALSRRAASDGSAHSCQ